jgi:hypothetical protein
MAETGKNPPIDSNKLATKEELKNSLRDVVRKKDLENLVMKKDLHQAGGIKRWLNANWAGVLVAFIALLTSVYSGYETRKHARLSVKPHISLGFYANEEGAGWARTISGLGPAIINVFEVTVDGEPVQTWDQVLVLFGIDPRAAKARFVIPTPGTYLLPSSNATAWLLWIGSPLEARTALVKNSQRLQIKLAYCSLYDECWERSAAELEPTPVAKRKPTIAFGTSQQWLDTHSKSK